VLARNPTPFWWQSMSLWKPLFKLQPVWHCSHFECVLGTSMELGLLAESSKYCKRAEQAALNEIERLEKVFNAYRPDSELQIWQQKLNQPVPVSVELAEVLHTAEVWRKATGGAFQPGAEAFTRLWKQAAASNTTPAAGELEATALKLSGPLWTVDLNTCVACRHIDVPVTLNAIAKGYILDRACEAAASQPGIQAAMVNIGGDIRHIGCSPAMVAVADPCNPHENAKPLAAISVQNQGMATSGGYRRGFQVGDQWRSHLLDPRTGQSVHQTVSVTAVAESAMLADILTTAFSILAPSESLAIGDKVPGAALLIVSEDGCQSANERWRRIAK
jgi:FAD:protein FMN transferase